MIFAELPLSISTWWMFNSSTLSMITSGSSWGCLMLRLSLSVKTISGSHSLASSLEGAANGHYLFLSHGLFSGTSAFCLPSILLRSSLSLLWEVFYLLLLNLCLYRPSIGICRAPFSWLTSVTSLVGLKSPPGLSNVYTRQCDARGPSGTYSTCSYLFFLLEYWLASAIAGRDRPLSASTLA